MTLWVSRDRGSSAGVTTASLWRIRPTKYSQGMPEVSVEKSYVVQRPHSATNKSDLFRVSEFHSWQSYINGDSYTYEYESYPTYEGARNACDRLNGDTVK